MTKKNSTIVDMVPGAFDRVYYTKQFVVTPHLHGVDFRYTKWIGSRVEKASGSMSREHAIALADALYAAAGEAPKPKAEASPHGPQEYKGNGHHKWEFVVEQTWRLRVPGGWLYQDQSMSPAGVTFVPMPAALCGAVG